MLSINLPFFLLLKGPLKDQGIRVNCLFSSFAPTPLVEKAFELTPDVKEVVQKAGMVK